MPSQAKCFSIRFGKPIRPHARFLAQMHGGAFLTDARIPYRKRRSVTVRSVGIAIGGEIGPVQPHSPCQIVMPSNERTPAFRKASKGEPQIGRVEGSGIIPRHSDIEMIVVWRGPTACGPFADQCEIAELADMHRLPIFSRSDELIGRVADQHVDVVGLAALDDTLLLIGKEQAVHAWHPLDDHRPVIFTPAVRWNRQGLGGFQYRSGRDCTGLLQRGAPQCFEQTDYVGLRMLQRVLPRIELP